MEASGEMARRGLAAMGAVVLIGIGVGSASANNFGGHYVSSSCCFMYGSRADIATPASNFTLQPGTFGVMRVTSESTPKIIQAGYGQTNGAVLTNGCGANSTLKNYVEVIDKFGVASCSWVGVPGYGVANKYSTFKENSSDTWWDAAVNGVVKTSGDLGFQTSGLSVAGGELGPGTVTSGHLYGCYGCNGNLAWQRATLPASQSWVTIQSSNPLNDDTRWTIGPGASPFTISHPYP